MKGEEEEKIDKNEINTTKHRKKELEKKEEIEYELGLLCLY